MDVNKNRFLLFNTYLQLSVGAIFLGFHFFFGRQINLSLYLTLTTASSLGLFFLLQTRPKSGLKTADQITVLRLVIFFACCIAYTTTGLAWYLVIGIVAFLILDGLDGYIARRQGPSDYGAYLDGEVDAIGVFILSLTIAFIHPWFLLAGLWRYLLLISIKLFPVLFRKQKRRNRARYIFGAFLLIAALASIVSDTDKILARRLYVFSLCLLSISFLEDFFRLYVRGSLQKFTASYRRFLGPIFWILALNSLLHLNLAFGTRSVKAFFKPAHEILLIQAVLIIGLSFGFLKNYRPGRWLMALAAPYFIFVFIDTGGQYFLGESFRIFNYIDQLPIFLSDDLFKLYTLNQILLLSAGFVGLIFFATWVLKKALASWVNLYHKKNMRRVATLTFSTLLVFALLWGNFFYENFGLRFSFFPEHPVSYRFVQNIKTLGLDDGFRRKIASVAERKVAPLNQLEKTNVYLFVLEAYGEIIFRKQLYPTFQKTIRRVETRLKKGGWQSVSGHAVSTVAGGGSWMAEASLACGLEIKNRPQMNSLLNADNIKCIAHYFRASGHHTLVSRPMTIRPYPAGKVFGFHKNLYNRHYPWQGTHFGWARIADQYVLDYTYRKYIQPLVKQKKQPFFAEFILVNSHFRWSRLPKYYPDWKFPANGSRYTKADLAYQTNDIDRPLQVYRQDFENSIDYVWQSLVGFIEHYVQDDTLIIFIGDHQPSRSFSGNYKNRNVPIHIISKDPKLLKPWLNRGLQTGFYPAGKTKAIPFAKFLPLLADIYSSGSNNL